MVEVLGVNRDDVVFSLRLPRHDTERLRREARARGVTISEMARRAIAAGLASPRAVQVSWGSPSGAPLTVLMFGVSRPPDLTIATTVAWHWL